MRDLVVAITGASGAVYALRLVEVLREAGRNVHLTISPAAVQVLQHECGLKVDLTQFEAAQLWPNQRGPRQQGPKQQASDAGRLVYHHHLDFTAGIASGSFRTDGMVICPCSMGTLGSLAGGLSTNLIHRAAEVHLKERRKLILVPRETPLSSISLENMKRLSDAGAVILPAMPGFYHGARTIADLVDFVVGRICDQLGVETELARLGGK
jgi:4-hydroxy-3-polyprenylbenzoate decarboxylase